MVENDPNSMATMGWAVSLDDMAHGKPISDQMFDALSDTLDGIKSQCPHQLWQAWEATKNRRYRTAQLTKAVSDHAKEQDEIRRDLRSLDGEADEAIREKKRARLDIQMKAVTDLKEAAERELRARN